MGGVGGRKEGGKTSDETNIMNAEKGHAVSCKMFYKPISSRSMLHTGEEVIIFSCGCCEPAGEDTPHQLPGDQLGTPQEELEEANVGLLVDSVVLRERGWMFGNSLQPHDIIIMSTTLI